MNKRVLWWGRFDPNYSRNRILRAQFEALGWDVFDFHPHVSQLADIEAAMRKMPLPEMVWVPCFRQRDIAAASRWAKTRHVPLVFDPLISAYDKRVDEWGKLRADSARARRLLAWERGLFRRADHVVADTPAHAAYFSEVLEVDERHLSVIYVGAEEGMFMPAATLPRQPSQPAEALFYGSFIPLQGPEIIIEAAKCYQGTPVRWTLIGDGPLRKACEEKARELKNVSFEDWVPYEDLSARIHRANVLLGVFGVTPKAGRVIPNKVYQSLACGRPVITRRANAYPEALKQAENSGLLWVDAGNPQALADSVAQLLSDLPNLDRLGLAAAETNRRYFSQDLIRNQLEVAIKSVPAH